MLYLWFKALHIISVIAWFAALFYLPRLFVYHAQTQDETGKERFILMERKLYKLIANPAMMATILFGIGMVSVLPSIAQGGWFHAKMALVAALLVFHFMCKAHLKKFASGSNQKSDRYFRYFNEVPSVLLVLIVILVVIKPF